MKSMSPKKNIVVVGGGYGANVASRLSRTLDSSTHNLILINNRPCRIHLISALRMIVTPADDLEHTSMLPYDKLFQKGCGTFKQGTLVGIEKSADLPGGVVVLESEERIEFDVLVLATGSRWPGPLHFPTEPEEISATIHKWRKDIEDAQSIVLIGGGGVGLELAGEIMDDYPSKKVAIVHSGIHVLHDTYPDTFRAEVEKGIRARGVELVLGDRLEDPTIKDGYVVTKQGRNIPADLVILTRGPKPNTEPIISSLGSSVASSSGHIKVRPTLQLPDHPEIFAMGDIADLPEQKQAYKAQWHAYTVAGNVLAYLSSRKMKEYNGVPEIIIVTNGKAGGRGYFGFLWGLAIGDWLSSLFLSRKLAIKGFARSQGYSWFQW